MAPKTGNKKATIDTNVQPNGVTGTAKPAALNYDEVQADEVEVLKAIYMDDYEEVELKTAWQRTTDRSFKLRLRPFTEDDRYVVLTVRLTATYPRTAPLLEVQGLETYHERTQKRIQNIVSTRPKQLIGEVMIHDLCNSIQDALEDAVQARRRGTLPSLEDERAGAEEVATALAKEAEDAEVRKQQEVQEEEDRMLKQMVDEELNRRARRKPIQVSTEEVVQSATSTNSHVLALGQEVSIEIDGHNVQFSDVNLMSLTHKDRNEEVYLGSPRVGSATPGVIVMVKRIQIQKDRDDIIQLESALTSVRNIRHPGLLNLLAFRVDKLANSRSEVTLCTEHAERGSLGDILELGAVAPAKAKQLTVGILESLDFLHRNGLVHGDLDIDSIALSGKRNVAAKLTGFGYAGFLRNQEAKVAKWKAPEVSTNSTAMLRKADIWQCGIVVAQLFLGLDVIANHKSPQTMMNKLALSDAFEDMMGKMFMIDLKRRPSAFDLLPAEFLRTDGPVMDTPLVVKSDTSATQRRVSNGFPTPVNRRDRHNSSSAFDTVSRYATDFTQVGRLGKGGFGEVVKARNKLDGGVYAIKKIKQASKLLDQVISEVMLLNRLNHPYVVRYFSTWIEEDVSDAVIDESTTDTETATETLDETADSRGSRVEFGYQSMGGLDFVSSSGFPPVVFGEDSNSSSAEDESDGESQRHTTADEETSAIVDNSDHAADVVRANFRKSRADSRNAPSTLYIQMEYCERQTLRDLIRKAIEPDDAWRLVRQVTEGLAHVHDHGIIHRDLKPDNVFIDAAGNPKIGDFGLATTGQHYMERATNASVHSAGDLTRSIGTTLYVAPELRSASNSSYSNKVDMYSLGIIFYEMCEPFSTGMQRIAALQQIREVQYELPPSFRAGGGMAAQGKLISVLIAHKPGERPSSAELLRSDVLPMKIEDETIRQALSGLSDPKSPYHLRMMSALFARNSVHASRVKALAWDVKALGLTDHANVLRLKNIARRAMAAVFRHHGADEARRETIFPRSDLYANAQAVQVLDASGNLLQLPYDLTLPFARQLAREKADLRCTFSFGSAYRDTAAGGPPRTSEEVDFDIVDTGAEDEQRLNDAEIIKVMDEIASAVPRFASSTTISFYLNHSYILDTILEYCRIPVPQQPTIKEIISRLGFHQHTWSKVRVELRKFGLLDTALDDLQQFDFRDEPDRAYSRLKSLLGGASPKVLEKLDIGLRTLTQIVEMTHHLNIQRKIYVAPLGSVNAKFYEDGMLFQCVLEHKSTRAVIAAGGRYDSLIRAHRSIESRVQLQGAVGVSIGLDPVVAHMAKSGTSTSKKTSSRRQKYEEPIAKRCNALVIANGSEAVQSAGLKIVSSLWASEISAELTSSSNTSTDDHIFTITVRHEASNTVRVVNTEKEGTESDIAIPALSSHLQQELRERESSKSRPPMLLRHASSHYDNEGQGHVQVLMARHGSKKSNKYQIVGDAREQWTRKLEGAKDAPILAVEARDDLLDAVQQTQLSDAESWRKVVQSVQVSDRQYVQQIQEVLTSWRKLWEQGNGSREACVFNFRTQSCVYYDIGL